jgi:hypothetical protein
MASSRRHLNGSRQSTHNYVPTATNPQRQITLYVDNCTISAHCSQVHKIKEIIKHKFPTKDLGKAKSILSFKLHCDHKDYSM